MQSVISMTILKVSGQSLKSRYFLQNIIMQRLLKSHIFKNHKPRSGKCNGSHLNVCVFCVCIVIIWLLAITDRVTFEATTVSVWKSFCHALQGLKWTWALNGRGYWKGTTFLHTKLRRPCSNTAGHEARGLGNLHDTSPTPEDWRDKYRTRVEDNAGLIQTTAPEKGEAEDPGHGASSACKPFSPGMAGCL